MSSERVHAGGEQIRDTLRRRAQGAPEWLDAIGVPATRTVWLSPRSATWCNIPVSALDALDREHPARVQLAGHPGLSVYITRVPERRSLGVAPNNGSFWCAGEDLVGVQFLLDGGRFVDAELPCRLIARASRELDAPVPLGELDYITARPLS